MRYLSLITEHWLALLISTLVCAAVAVGLSFLPQQLYESRVELLIVQKATTDTYTAQKAAEKLGKNLITIIHSFDFLDRVIATGFIKPEQFSSNPKEKSKQWNKLVKAQVVPETGIINVYGYGISQGAAENVALGVMQVLTTNAADYHGAGDSVTIKHISGPITSDRPVKPNIPLNGVAAGVLGFMMVYTFFLLQSESKRAAEEKQQSQQGLHYQLPGTQQEVFPIEAPEYKVLDAKEMFTFGETLSEESPPNDDNVVIMPVSQDQSDQNSKS